MIRPQKTFFTYQDNEAAFQFEKFGCDEIGMWENIVNILIEFQINFSVKISIQGRASEGCFHITR